jgi:Fe2+ transport system protein FeoA
VIVSLGGSGAIRQRLLDMGITRGAELRVERRAPLGDPIEIRVKGYYLALRHEEARDIMVEERGAPPVAGQAPCSQGACGRGRGWRHRFGFGRREE